LFKHHVKNISIAYCKNLSKIRKKNIEILEIKLNKLKQYKSTNDESIANIEAEIITSDVPQQQQFALKKKFYFEYEKSNSYFYNLEKKRGKQKSWSKIKNRIG